MQKGHPMQPVSFPFDLQIFADEGNPSGGNDSGASVAEAGTTDTAATGLEATLSNDGTPITSTGDNLLLQLLQGKGQSDSAQQGIVENTATENIDSQPPAAITAAPDFSETMKQFGLNFKSPEQLAESYKNSQAAFTTRSQEYAQMLDMQKQQKADIAQMMELVQNNNRTEATDGEADAGEVQDMIFNDPELLDRFYEKPSEVIAEVAKQIAQQQIQEALLPVQQFQQQLAAEREQLATERQEHETQQAINTSVEQFQASNPDFVQYEDEMAQFIETLPPGITSQMEYGQILDIAYNSVRGKSASTQPTLDQQMQDDAFLTQLSQNPRLRDMILKGHIANVGQQASQIPPVLGTNNVQGTAPSAEPNAPKTMQDSGSSWLKSLGISR